MGPTALYNQLLSIKQNKSAANLIIKYPDIFGILYKHYNIFETNGFTGILCGYWQ